MRHAFPSLRSRANILCRFAFAASVCLAMAPPVGAADGPHDLAKQILEATGIRGGLIVHWECGNGN